MKPIEHASAEMQQCLATVPAIPAAPGAECDAALAFRRLTHIRAAIDEADAARYKADKQIEEMQSRNVAVDSPEWGDLHRQSNFAIMAVAWLKNLETAAEETVIAAKATTLEGAIANLCLAWWTADDTRYLVPEDKRGEANHHLKRAQACLYAALTAIESAGGLNRSALGADIYFPHDFDPNAIAEKALSAIAA